MHTIQETFINKPRHRFFLQPWVITERYSIVTFQSVRHINGV